MISSVAHAEGDAFQQRADEHRPGGAGGDSDPTAAGVRIGVGAAFAGEIGKKLQPSLPGGAAWLFDQQGVGVDFSFLLRPFRFAKLIAKPLERSAGREHAAKDAPFARDGMAHGMDAAMGIARRPIAVGENDATGAQRGADDARWRRFHFQRRPPPGPRLRRRQGCPRKAQSSAARGGERSRSPPAIHAGCGKQSFVDLQEFQQLVGPRRLTTSRRSVPLASLTSVA